MTGLEQIIRQIEDDAAASVVSIRQKAEEEAAASQTLSDEAGRLDSIVASFRLRQRARTE